MSENECIICFETFKKEENQYVCRNDCFFNNKSECHICNQCLNTWVSYDEEATIFKCPICTQRKLRDSKKKCEYQCSCSIGCDNVIYPEGIIFYKNERFRSNCRYIVSLLSFLLFLEVLGFALTNAWLWFIEYDNEEYTEKVRDGKWLEPSFYLITCPFASLMFFVILASCMGFIKCLDNIC